MSSACKSRVKVPRSQGGSSMIAKVGRFVVYFMAVFLILSLPINERSLFSHVAEYTQPPITKTVQGVESTMYSAWHHTRSFLLDLLS